jgi:hypothetical protein
MEPGQIEVVVGDPRFARIHDLNGLASRDLP